MPKAVNTFVELLCMSDFTDIEQGNFWEIIVP